MKKITFSFLIVGLITLASVFFIRQKMESNREQIELISSDLEGLTPDNAQYDSLINERIPYLDQNMDLDLYSKIALAGGAVSILLGIIFFFVGKKK